MSTAYLDSTGNVTTTIANDVANFNYAVRAAQAVPQALATAQAQGTQLASDSVTGRTGGASFN
jgi:hypothetical protein